jgi:hypothetical protein
MNSCERRLHLVAASLDPKPAPCGPVTVPWDIPVRWALIVAALIIGALASSGCATPKRGAYCRDWCDPLALLTVYSDGTCVCSAAQAPSRYCDECGHKKPGHIASCPWAPRRSTTIPPGVIDPEIDFTALVQSPWRGRIPRVSP